MAKSTCGSAQPATVTLGTLGAADIVDTAVSAGSFETLVTAVKAAGLVDALKGDGPFTVFAPTDDAFAKLPKGTLHTLLRPENRALLTSILTFHVVPGQLSARDVTRLSGASSLNGQRIDFATSDAGVMIDGAKVLKADIECRNGIIHVIDSVIMPTTQDIVDTANSAGQFGTLLAAAKAAGLAGVLKSDGPFTVLAPTDAAFAALGQQKIHELLEPANKPLLAAILKYHVIPGRVDAIGAVKAGSAKTVQGSKVQFDVRDGSLFVDGARVLATDIDASNGMIHVIDKVILPPMN
ncbi:MAG: fasciclin domain-containing protein [Phycisphaerales bacterium]|nr:fasciclin domain-containing protein [Phycisphaerae bacterium]NNF44110.1 fasciclin domain-containing protein [Phycisphaerales bacterium]NNM24768.1 fasciclin domain-containing protein [Phycisphaerales bacterium]